MTTLNGNTSSIANLSDKHCIFRCGEAMFSLPATAVREIALAPAIVPVPVSHKALVGIGHVRSEFIPIVALAPIVGDQAMVTQQVKQLLIMSSPLGDWGLLIDSIVEIAPVETHVTAEHRNDTEFNALLGTATQDGAVLSVLDVNGLQRVIQHALQTSWSNFCTAMELNVNPTPTF